MFVGREQELSRLEKMYQSGKPEVAVIYGRRRVGKTALINEFCKEKPSIFFTGLEGSARLNLEVLSASVSEYLQEEHPQENRQAGSSADFCPESFPEALASIGELAKSSRLVFVIDEFPYLAKAEMEFPSELQKFLDHQFQDTELFLILCGSSETFMQKQVLNYQSPLYRRITGQFKILPLDYADSARWFPSYTEEEKALMYGVTGGIPMYLAQFSPKKSVRENLMDGIFNKNAYLFEEPVNFLKQELREPSVYNSIMQSITAGNSKLSEISSDVGIESGLCSIYMDNLITMGILKKVTPVTNPASKRPIYEVEDLFFRFWYTFVYKNMPAVLSGKMEQIYAKTVEQNLPAYMEDIYPRICRDYLVYYDHQLPFFAQSAGQWWEMDSKTHQKITIDLVLPSMDHQKAIVGSCNFKNETVSVNDWQLLQEKAQRMGGFLEYDSYLFGKNRFDKELTSLQDGKHLRLITLEEIYESAK